VYYNKIQEKPEAERAAYVEGLREQYRQDVDIYKLAADLHIDAILTGDRVREELIRRLAAARHKRTQQWPRKRAVLPV
jgi:acetyl-CoA carboxylase carboxyltransferase component